MPPVGSAAAHPLTAAQPLVCLAHAPCTIPPSGCPVTFLQREARLPRRVGTASVFVLCRPRGLCCRRESARMGARASGARVANGEGREGRGGRGGEKLENRMQPDQYICCCGAAVSGRARGVLLLQGSVYCCCCCCCCCCCWGPGVWRAGCHAAPRARIGGRLHGWPALPGAWLPPGRASARRRRSGRPPQAQTAASAAGTASSARAAASAAATRCRNSAAISSAFSYTSAAQGGAGREGGGSAHAHRSTPTAESRPLACPRPRPHPPDHFSVQTGPSCRPPPTRRRCCPLAPARPHPPILITPPTWIAQHVSRRRLQLLGAQRHAAALAVLAQHHHLDAVALRQNLRGRRRRRRRGRGERG